MVTLYKAGHENLKIAEELGISRTTVRNFVYAGAFPERANILRTKSILEPDFSWLLIGYQVIQQIGRIHRG